MLDDPNVKLVRLFRPGKIGVLPGGAKVICGEDGKWYRVLGESKNAPVPPATPPAKE